MINLVCALLKNYTVLRINENPLTENLANIFMKVNFSYLSESISYYMTGNEIFFNKTWRNFYSEVWNFYEREFWILNHLTLGFENLRFYLFSHCSARKHWSFPFKDLIYYLSNGTEFNTRLFSHWSSFLAEVSMSGRGGQLQN